MVPCLLIVKMSNYQPKTLPINDGFARYLLTNLSGFELMSAIRFNCIKYSRGFGIEETLSWCD